MPTAVLICAGGDEPWRDDKTLKLLSGSGLAVSLELLPRNRIGAALAGKNVIFLRRDDQWADDELVADELRTRLEMPSFRIFNTEKLVTKALQPDDVVIVVGKIDGDDWLIGTVVSKDHRAARPEPSLPVDFRTESLANGC